MGHHPTRVFYQMVQQAEFCGAQTDALAFDYHIAPIQVNAQPVVNSNDGLFRCCRALDAPHNRPNAAGEFASAERLGDVVVGSQLQAAHLVLLVVPHCQHDHGDAGDLAQRSQRLEAVQLGHHHVQENQIGQLGAHLI